MRYQDSVVRNVIESTDLVDLISQYVTLKKTGRNYSGCCPFHNEKTPSFSVSPEKQLYHCFGCGVSGNVISFVEQMENLRFLEAIEFLADRAGIVLPKTADPQEEKRYQKKLRLYEMHRQAANHYYRRLTKDKAAQRYLAGRGFTADTIKKFGMGVSSGEWQDLVRILSANRFSEEEMLEAGLILKGKNGRLYDRFRNRIMIPILNIQDKIVGFGGRAYLDGESDGPKYLNSPETSVFSKGRELFHLNRAKKHIVNDRLIVVEGYMDVISLSQYGFLNVTAALGTAFTPEHAKILARYAKEAVLCFDGDAAGEKATKRAIEILRTSTVNVRILRLDEKEDPDSFIQKNGSEAFLQAIENAMTVTDFELNGLARQYDLSHSDGKVKYLNEAVLCLKKLTNPLEQEMYVRKTADFAGISPERLLKAVNSKGKDLQPMEAADFVQQRENRLPRAYREAQEMVLRELLAKGKMDTELTASDFSPGIYRRLFQLIVKYSFEKDPAVLMAKLPDGPEKTRLMTLLFEGGENSEVVLRESISVVKKYGQSFREKAAIQKILRDQDDENIRLQELNALTKSMKENTEGV